MNYENTKLAFELRAFICAVSNGTTVCKEEGENLAAKMLNMVNCLVFDEEHFAVLVADGLPFQSCNVCVDMFLALMERMHKGTFDARNEAAWKLSHSLAGKFCGAEANPQSMVYPYIEEVCLSHRTLQQSICRLWVEIIRRVDAHVREEVSFMEQTNGEFKGSVSKEYVVQLLEKSSAILHESERLPMPLV